jgi:hypothetical protein
MDALVGVAHLGFASMLGVEDSILGKEGKEVTEEVVGKKKSDKPQMRRRDRVKT